LSIQFFFATSNPITLLKYVQFIISQGFGNQTLVSSKKHVNSGDPVRYTTFLKIRFNMSLTSKKSDIEQFYSRVILGSEIVICIPTWTSKWHAGSRINVQWVFQRAKLLA
jgi:hypothetical protein